MTLLVLRRQKEIGLINNAVSKEELASKVTELAEKIASKSTMTVATGKKAFYAQAEMDLSKAYQYTSKLSLIHISEPTRPY